MIFSSICLPPSLPEQLLKPTNATAQIPFPNQYNITTQRYDNNDNTQNQKRKTTTCSE